MTVLAGATFSILNLVGVAVFVLLLTKAMRSIYYLLTGAESEEDKKWWAGGPCGSTSCPTSDVVWKKPKQFDPEDGSSHLD